ncbi:MAG: ECF transporter S component [Promethearchaeota archaeon]
MEPPPQNKLKKPTYYYETSDLVIIALFASLGGVFSSFIGYLGKLFGLAIGFPQGGGQIFAGLHILWFVLVFLQTDRKVGTVILCGIIKGFIELFSASHLGIIVLYVSIGEALVFEIVYFSLSILPKALKIESLILISAAGLAAVSNIVIRLNTFLGFALPLEIFILILGVCFISGVVFGGYLGLFLFQLFEQSRLLSWRKETKKPDKSFSSTKTSK